MLTSTPAMAQTTAAEGPALDGSQPHQADVAAPYREAAISKWAEQIDQLRQRDVDVTPAHNAVLLIGSSSIRRWTDADRFFAPRPVINRGYGGARYSDLVVFADTLISPHQFEDLIIFIGNDIAGKPQDKTPAEVEPLVRHVVAVARAHQPAAMIHLVEVTPSPKRFDVWPRIRALNAMLREVAFTEPNVSFVATAETYLDRNDQPLIELFVEDRLHLNDDGYDRWASILVQAVNAE
ncbi:MAG: GDSL-type esterase/lipase family protein [Planctomycetota bacterium]